MRVFSKKTVLLIIALVIVAFGTVSCTGYLVNKELEGLRKDAGLKVKSMKIPDFKIVYAEGGTGDTIIMLHGFEADKDYWPSFAKYFTPHYRVIIPDLSGFGDSSKPKDKNYNIMSQVERLNLFAKKLKLTKFHLVGNSMGGAIAGNYAATYPEMIESLALFDSAGVVAPTNSELILLMEKGEKPFFVKDVNDYDKLFKLAWVNPPEFPSFIMKYLAKKAVKEAPFNEKIWNDMISSDIVDLENKLDKITVPTLILWGDSDKIIDISSVPIFEKGIKNSKSVIIKECGHLPMMEKPMETASAYQEFLKGNNY
ncbi:MAG: alpha/beta fold hydrolase [Smithella sp.]